MGNRFDMNAEAVEWQKQKISARFSKSQSQVCILEFVVVVGGSVRVEVEVGLEQKFRQSRMSESEQLEGHRICVIAWLLLLRRPWRLVLTLRDIATFATPIVKPLEPRREPKFTLQVVDVWTRICQLCRYCRLKPRKPIPTRNRSSSFSQENARD